MNRPLPWRARRVIRDDVAHVSLWNLPGPHGPIWERVGSASVAAWRRDAWPEARIASALTQEFLPALTRVIEELDISDVYCAGGLLRIEAFAEHLRSALPVRFHLNSDGRFAGVRGGRALLHEECARPGAIVDVGQTAIKASRSDERIVAERNLEHLPLELIDPQRPPVASAARTHAAATFIANAAAAVLSDLTALVLALPGPLERDLIPGACSYGWEGDQELLPRVLAHLEASLPQGGDVLVLNDAELIAESARADLAPQEGTRILCVSLGFGPGGALLSPGQSEGIAPPAQ